MEIALKFIKENLTSKINIITMKELMVYLAVGRFTFFLVDMHTWDHQLKSVVYIAVHFLCCTFNRLLL